MQQLLRLAPATALLLTTDPDGHVTAEEEVPIALVQRGDLLKVLAPWRTSSPCAHAHAPAQPNLPGVLPQDARILCEWAAIA